MISQFKFVSIFLVFCIYLARAAELKILSKNDSYNNVVQWWLPESANAEPVPIFQNAVLINEKTLQFNNPVYFLDAKHSFLGIMEIEDKRENTILKIRWFDQKTIQRGNVQFKLPFDFPFPGSIISPDGNNLISIFFDNLIKVYDSDGIILNEFTIVDNYQFNYENNILYVQPENTNLIFTAVTQAGFPLNNTNVFYSELVLVDLKGSKIFSKKYPDWQVTSVNASKDAQFFTVAMHHVNNTNGDIVFKTIVLDENGEEISILPIRHRRSFFNQTLNKILFLDKNIIYLFSINDKEIVNQVKLTQPANMFIEAEFLKEGKIISILEGELISAPEYKNYPWAYINILLKVINIERKVKEDFALPGNVKIIKPSLIYNNFKDKIFFGHTNGWKILKYQP